MIIGRCDTEDSDVRKIRSLIVTERKEEFCAFSRSISRGSTESIYIVVDFITRHYTFGTLQENKDNEAK